MSKAMGEPDITCPSPRHLGLGQAAPLFAERGGLLKDFLSLPLYERLLPIILDNLSSPTYLSLAFFPISLTFHPTFPPFPPTHCAWVGRGVKSGGGMSGEYRKKPHSNLSKRGKGWGPRSPSGGGRGLGLGGGLVAVLPRPKGRGVRNHLGALTNPQGKLAYLRG